MKQEMERKQEMEHYQRDCGDLEIWTDPSTAKRKGPPPTEGAALLQRYVVETP